MLKLFAAALAAAVMAGSAAHAQDKPKIGLVQIDLSNPFHLGEVDGAKEAARRAGFDLVVTSGEGDVTKQIQAMENLINEGVSAISINFIDAAAFGPTMAKAAAAKIPVICLHSKIEGCAATLGFDERYTGKIVGEYAVELLKKRYNGEVKGEVETQWRAEETATKLSAKARELVQKLDKGEAFQAVASAAGLTVETATGLTRQEQRAELPANVVTQVFGTVAGKANSAAAADGSRILFKVDSATVPPYVQTAQEAENFVRLLTSNLSEGLLMQYVVERQAKLGVSINEAAFRNATGGAQN